MKRAPVPDGEIEYEIRGDGEPVLFIHGAFIAGSFLPIMDEPALAGYQRIRYHRRGFADSTAPIGSLERQTADAVALLEHLGVERAHIVGHSGGGRIALQLALDVPDIVHSLVLLEPAGVGPVPSQAEYVEDVVEPATERYQAGDPAAAVDLFMRRVMGMGPEWRTEISRMVPGGPEQAAQDAATFFENPTPPRQIRFDEETAKRLSPRIPILYVWGSETLDLLKEGGDLLLSWFPRVEDHRVDGLGHSLQMQDPRALSEGIADFLRRHPFAERSTR